MRTLLALASLVTCVLGASCVLVLGDERTVVFDRDAGHGGAGGAGGSGGAGAAGGAGGADGPVQCDAGKVIWAKRLGGAAKETPVRVAPDGDGGVVLAGVFEGALDLGGGTPLQAAGEQDVFVARFDRDGGYVWSTSFGGSGVDSVASVAVAPDGGDVVVGGHFTDTVDFGDGAHTAVGLDAYVSRLSANDGAHRWTFTATGPDDQFIKRVAVDPATGRILLTAGFRAEIDLGVESHVSAGDKDMLLAALDGGGALVWSQRFGGPDAEGANGLGVDAQGRIVLAGSIGRSVDFGSGELPVPVANPQHSDAFVAVFSSAGALVWAKNWGDDETQDLRSLVLDPTGGFLVAGRNDGTLDFGGGPLVGSFPGSTAFFARLDGNGDHVASGQLPRQVYTEFDVAVDIHEKALFAGRFDAPVNVAGDLVPAGDGGDAGTFDPDALIVGFDAKLDPVWTIHFGDAKFDAAQAATADAEGNAFVAAEFWGTVSIPGCPGSFTHAGASDILLLKLAP